MLYYQILYNVSTTCFDHYLAIIRFYKSYRVTVLHNEGISSKTHTHAQSAAAMFISLLGNVINS